MPLRREAGDAIKQSWTKQHVAGLISAAVGIVAVVVAAILCFGGDETVRIPSLWVTMPLLTVALLAAITSFVRQERAYALPISGIALATAAVVLGWAIVVGIVAAITAVVILVMQELM